MEIINLKSQYSKIMSFDRYNQVNNQNIILLTIIKIEDIILIEYVEKTDEIYYINEQREKIEFLKQQQQPQAQVVESKELVEAKNTILNTDPFGSHRHAGKTLGEIVAADMEWVNHALKNMTNEYIRNRLQLIVDSMR